jgi:hypothetical protein
MTLGSLDVIAPEESTRQRHAHEFTCLWTKEGHAPWRRLRNDRDATARGDQYRASFSNYGRRAAELIGRGKGEACR